MIKPNNIKRTIVFSQHKKTKKFYIQKKKFLSNAKKSKNFRFFDEDGYEIFDPVLINIIFTNWHNNFVLFQNYNVVMTLDEELYTLFEDDEY